MSLPRPVAGLLIVLLSASALATSKASAPTSQTSRSLRQSDVNLQALTVCSVFNYILRTQRQVDAMAGQLLTNAWSEATHPTYGFIRDPISLRNITVQIPSSAEIPARGTVTFRTLGGLSTLHHPSVRVQSSRCSGNTLAAQSTFFVQARRLRLNITANVELNSVDIALPRIDVDGTITMTNVTLAIGSSIGATLNTNILRTCDKIMNITSLTLTYADLGVALQLPRSVQFLTASVEQAVAELIRGYTSTLTNPIKDQLNAELHSFVAQQCPRLSSILSNVNV